MPENEKIFKAKVNDFEFVFTQAMLDNLDLIKTKSKEYHVILHSLSRTAIVREADSFNKKLKVEIDGESFEVLIRDPLDQVLDNMGFNSVSTKQIKEIKAPMPGLVLDIAVNAGDELQEGDKVLILEAMKMENSIVMHAGGRIKKVTVKKGQAVEKGQVLVELE